MTPDQKNLVAVGCIILGIIVGIGTYQSSGKNRRESASFDRAINREIDRRNNWKPGTTDQLYPPGSSWQYSKPSEGVTFGGVATVVLLVTGAGILLSNKGKADSV